MPPATLSFVEWQDGPNAFIKSLVLDVPALAKVARVKFVVATKKNGTAAPVSATYTRAYLDGQELINGMAGTITVPVFGLYAGRGNTVQVTVAYTTGRSLTLGATVTTESSPLSDKYAPTFVQARNPGVRLGYGYFLLKAFGPDRTPIVMDVDGEVRWQSPAGGAVGSLFVDGHVLVGARGPSASTLYRVAMTGESLNVADYSGPNPSGLPNGYTGGYRDFHHNFDAGREGVLLELDRGAYNSEDAELETNIVEVRASDGFPLRAWDFAQIVRDYMLDNDVANVAPEVVDTFVRKGESDQYGPNDQPNDWFHNNAACYWRARNELVVSARELFVMGVGYDDKKIKWILGDPNKRWHQFACLAAKALTIPPGKGLYPIGQHAVSIVGGNRLMVFDNGLESGPLQNDPTGIRRGAGQTPPYSAARQYRLDVARRTATEVWTYDRGEDKIFSPVTSSVYQFGGSYLVLFPSHAADDTETPIAIVPGKIRAVGLDAAKRVAFEYTFGADAGPGALFVLDGWNAQPISLTNLVFK